MRLTVLLLGAVLVLGGCAREVPPRVRVLTCGDVQALALAIVDGRKRGQSRAEQIALVPSDSPLPSLHRGFVTSIYDAPRPTRESDWVELARESTLAAEVYCVNRPARILRGQLNPV